MSLFWIIRKIAGILPLLENPNLWNRVEDRSAPTDSEILEAIGEPTRYRIFQILLHAVQPLNVTEITQSLGRKDLPTISRHLKTLRVNGIVKAEKHGVEKRYRVDLDYIAPVIESLYRDFVKLLTDQKE